MLQPVQAPMPTGSQWVDRVKQLSAVFSSTSGLDTSEVLLSETHGTMFYLNSEGFKSITPVGSAYLRVYAEAQADDGATVRDLFTVTESRLEDLPPLADLISRATALANRTKMRRTAPIGEEFTGPILVEGQASAELLRQTLVPLTLARRPPDAENPRFAQGQGQSTPFLTRIGLRVLSDSFAASDTPSLKEFDGRPVAGAYVVDDEGVPAKDVTLVEKGRLVTLLTSRTPQKNLLQSNGHGRGGNVQAGVSAAQHSGRSGITTETEVSRAAQSAGQALRLHRPLNRGAWRGRGRRWRWRADYSRYREGHAGRKGTAGARPALRRCAVDSVPRHPGGVRGAHAAQLPDQRSDVRLGHRAQSDFRGDGSSEDERDRSEATYRSLAAPIRFRLKPDTPYVEELSLRSSAITALIVALHV